MATASAPAPARTSVVDPDLWNDIRARSAELRLVDFVAEAWRLIEPDVPFLRNWHIDATCDHLEAVSRGEITRLIVNMPPRYGKSTVISICWPVWEWLRIPGQRWIFYSYKNDLARDHSVKRRTIMESEWFRRYWGTRFRLTSALEMRLENSRRGLMQASSANAPPHGKGGNRIVIDDPHDPLQAESDLERAKGIQTYKSSLYPRLNSKRFGAIVVVMQRLHQGDLTGELMEEDDWVQLKLPARSPGYTLVRTPAGQSYLREPGQPLWPEREDEETLARTERAMGPVIFAGQYLQEPAPPGGYMFRRDWFTIVDHAPPGRTVRYWDKAGTQGGGAYTAGVKMRRGIDGYYYVLDVFRAQLGSHERERAISQTMALDGPDVEVYVEQEPGSTGQESNLNTILRNPGYIVFSDRISGDKVVRARPYASFASVADSVRLVRGAWNEPYLGEIEMFPNSRYKDQVDGSSGAFNKLSLTGEPGEPTAAEPTAPAPQLYLPGLIRGSLG
jgi:predicted phage terminase large subunit-like protein